MILGKDENKNLHLECYLNFTSFCMSTNHQKKNFKYAKPIIYSKMSL